MKIKNIYPLLFLMSLAMTAQHAPADKQTKSILILNGTAHLGNGQVIENSAIGFKDGIITLVADASTIRLANNAYDETIDASGKQVYPGFIAPNSTLGLVEIDAVQSSDEFQSKCT
jgi:imidazolonepropionase-like amidohydrolase